MCTCNRPHSLIFSFAPLCQVADNTFTTSEASSEANKAKEVPPLFPASGTVEACDFWKKNFDRLCIGNTKADFVKDCASQVAHKVCLKNALEEQRKKRGKNPKPSMGFDNLNKKPGDVPSPGLRNPFKKGGQGPAKPAGAE